MLKYVMIRQGANLIPIVGPEHAVHAMMAEGYTLQNMGNCVSAGSFSIVAGKVAVNPHMCSESLDGLGPAKERDTELLTSLLMGLGPYAFTTDPAVRAIMAEVMPHMQAPDSPRDETPCCPICSADAPEGQENEMVACPQCGQHFVL